MDVFTSSYKNSPFVDNKTYASLCFTCCLVPKTLEQTYKPDGSISEEKHLDFSCENLHTAKELYEQGSADTLKYAKRCVEAVINSCKGSKKTAKSRIKSSWNIC